MWTGPRQGERYSKDGIVGGGVAAEAGDEGSSLRGEEGLVSEAGNDSALQDDLLEEAAGHGSHQEGRHADGAGGLAAQGHRERVATKVSADTH